jgi:phospholipase C
MHWPVRRTLAVVAAGGLCLAGTATAAATSATPHVAIGVAATPIQHVVVIFDENVSFDHYFGTYPNAANTDESSFHALRHTPSVNGLTPGLLNHNPNENNPMRLSNSEALGAAPP